ncbi:hypothetical protein BDR26DRAFT_1006888 [Obelidium mucronatum]|nr:hypothetical protein BDR26DRAFT_1006888 [Obelidium mucronatum]
MTIASTPLDLFDDPVSPASRRPISRAEHQILAPTADLSSAAKPARSTAHVWTHIFIPTAQTIFSLVLFVHVAQFIARSGTRQTALVALVASLLTLATAASAATAGSGSWKRRPPGTGTAGSGTAGSGSRGAHGGVYFLVAQSVGCAAAGGVALLFSGGICAGVGVAAAAAARVALSLLPPPLFGHAFGQVSDENARRLVGSGFLALATVFHPFVAKRNSSFYHISIVSAACFVLALISICSTIIGLSCRIAAQGHEISMQTFADNWLPMGQFDYTDFFDTLGVFFPLVTGVLAGSSRSAELSHPRRDIPRYTILAQFSTSAIYFCIIILLGFAFDRAALLRNSLSAANDLNLLVAIGPNKWVSAAGCLGIALGASVQGLTSATKLLKAISNDDLLPFLKVFKQSNASTATGKMISKWAGRFYGFLIAEVVLLTIPTDDSFKFVTVVYLICYLFINAAAALLTFIESPNWKPSWKYQHWTISAGAAVTSLLFSFFVSLPITLLVLTLLGVLIKIISHYEARSQYGVDKAKATGILLQVAKRNLWQVERKTGETQKTTDWRPSIMLFVNVENNETSGWKVADGHGMEFLAQLNKTGGLAVVCTVVKGKPELLPQTFKSEAIKACLLEEARKHHIHAFPQAVLAPTFRSGVFNSIQCCGIGLLRSNTVMLNWPSDMTTDFADVLRGIILLDKAVLLVKKQEAPLSLILSDAATIIDQTVDIYWILLDGGILTLIAHILLRNREWRHCALRIFVIANETDDCNAMKRNLLRTLKGLRIVAFTQVIPMKTCCDGETFGLLDSDLVVGVGPAASRKQSSMSLWSTTDFRESAASNDTVAAGNTASNNSIGVHEVRIKFIQSVNAVIREKSPRSRIVMTNLPSPGVVRENNDECAKLNYIECLREMVEGIPHIMLIKGTGSEVVTDFY